MDFGLLLNKHLKKIPYLSQRLSWVFGPGQQCAPLAGEASGDTNL